MSERRVLFRKGVLVLWLVSLPLVWNCGATRETKPSPDAARQFLKLRGYDFNEKSFFTAVEGSDLAAVNGFIAAGINPNAKDDHEGDTALMTAAARGDLDILNALLAGGA